MNDFHPSPAVLSAASRIGQPISRSALGAFAVVSLLIDKLKHLHIDDFAHGWHDLLFTLLAASFSIDLIVELIRCTASAIHGARNRLEPIWPAISDLATAVVSFLSVLLPPKWRPHPDA